MANWVNADEIASLLDTHFAALALFAAQWSHSPEDCVQDAILQLTRLPSPPDNIAAWLFHVVRKRAISCHRSSNRRRKHEQIAARLLKVTANPDDSPFDVQELAIALQELPDDQHEVVVARTWGKLGFAEIAALQETSTTTVFRRYESGLKTLRDRLEESCQKNQIRTTSQTSPNCPTN